MQFALLTLTLQGLLVLGLKLYAPSAIWSQMHVFVALLLGGVSWVFKDIHPELSDNPDEWPLIFFKTGVICIILSIPTYFFNDDVGRVFFENQPENNVIIDIAHVFIYGLLSIGAVMFITGYILHREKAGREKRRLRQM